MMGKVGKTMQFKLNFQAGRLTLPPLDGQQQAAVDAICAPHNSQHALLYGRPGAGRTRVALEIARSLHDTDKPGEVVMLVPDRLRADRLQATVEALLPGTVRPVRTPAALAYQQLNIWHVQRETPQLPPQLLTGAKEDAVLAELLMDPQVVWPDNLQPEVRALPSFRMEIRNLFERAREAGLDGAGLAELGQQFQVPIWVAGGQLLQLWDKSAVSVGSETEPAYYSSAQIQEKAAQVVSDWEETYLSEGVTQPLTLPAVIVVDDLQDCTFATLRFLNACAANGSRVIATANPDVAVATYRGGEPHLDGWYRELLSPQIYHLGPTYRGNQANSQLVDQLAASLPLSGGVERRALGAVNPNESKEWIRAWTFSSELAEAAAVVKTIQQHYVRHETPLKDIAVIVRNTKDAERIRQALVHAGIPVSVNSRPISYSGDPLTAMLLTLLSSRNCEELVLDLGDGIEQRIDQREEILNLLIRSPLVKFDPLQLQRVLDLVAQIAGDNLTTHAAFSVVQSLLNAEVTLDDATQQQVQLALLDPAYADTIEAISKTLGLIDLGRKLAEADPNVAVWELWNATGLEARLERIALSPSSEAVSADDRLDAVISLCRTADVWSQRNPGETAAAFADEQLALQLPADNLARVAQRPTGVEVLTVMQAAGREWPVVVIAGVQGDKWPNLATRNRLTRASEIAQRVNHPELNQLPTTELQRQLKIQSRVDELRTFVTAISRSSQYLYVFAVSNEDQVPSVFFDLVTEFCSASEENTDSAAVAKEKFNTPELPESDLRSLVAKLRKTSAQARIGAPENIAGDINPDAMLADRILAYLTHQGIRVANPNYWTGTDLDEIKPVEIFGSKKPVLSPSAIETLLQCPAKWFLTKHGGTKPFNPAASLGTLIHAIAEKYPHGGLEEMLTELELCWDDTKFNRGTELGRWAFEKASEKVTRMAAAFANFGNHPVEVERVVNVDVGPAIIFGFIDRLEHLPDGGVRVTDIKTGAVPSKAEVEKHRQLAFYQYALMHEGLHPMGARLLAIRENNPEGYIQPSIMGEAEPSVKLLEQTEEDLRIAAKRVAGPFYAAVPGTHCNYCDVQNSCPLMELGIRTIE